MAPAAWQWQDPNALGRTSSEVDDNGKDIMPWAPNSKRFRGVIIWQLVISFIVVSAGFDTVFVILVSQATSPIIHPPASPPQPPLLAVVPHRQAERAGEKMVSFFLRS